MSDGSVKNINQWGILRDWLLIEAKVKTQAALLAYERAIERPTLGRVWAFWCMDSMGMHQGEVEIAWREIQAELVNKDLRELL